MEKRIFINQGSIRASQNDEMVLVGRAVTYGSLSADLGGFRERCAPGCFKQSLASGRNVTMDFNHLDKQLPLGTTDAGTLTLKDGTEGLDFRCVLDKNQQAHRDLHSSIKRGDTKSCSWAFNVDGSDGEDFDTAKDENGRTFNRRTIKRATLYSISAVVHPAYPGTATRIDARSAAAARPVLKSETELLRAKLVKQADDIRVSDIMSPNLRAVKLVQLPGTTGIGNCRAYRDFDREREIRAAELKADKEKRLDELWDDVRNQRGDYGVGPGNAGTSGAGVSQPGSELDARPGAVPSFACAANSFSTSTRDDHRKASEQHIYAARHIAERKQEQWAERADAHYSASSAHAKAAEQSDDNLYAQYAGLAQVACNRVGIGQAGKKP